MAKYIIEIEDEPLTRQSALYGEDAVYRAHGFKSLVFDRNGLDKLIPFEEYIRQELEQKCYFPPKENKAAKRLNDLICDINPTEICAQIESDHLKSWCKTIQVNMKMELVRLPCLAEEGAQK